MNAVICPSCGKRTATAHPLESYRYRESGLPNVWLKGGVTETVCSSCKKKYIRIEKEQQLLQVLAMGLIATPRPLTGFEMKFVRGASHMSQAKLAEALKRRRETVAEREAKKGPPGISFADEVVLRWILLTQFREHLTKVGNSFLADHHKVYLDSFSDFFDDFSKRYVEEALGKTKLVAELHSELWSLDDAA